MELKGPEVKLIDYTKNPFNLSIASARTCYSSKGILYPEDMDSTEKAREIRDRVAKSTKKAGHLTTRQHPQFIFTLNRVSRQFVWAFLHSHPYYNSEQVSQRYVEVKEESYYIPFHLNSKLRNSYLQAIRYANSVYFSMIEELKPFVEKEFFLRFSSRAKQPEKWQTEIKKKCLEIARYILPLATHTYLFHTINGLTLHRYYRLMASFQVPEEQKLVIEEMVKEVKRIDPLFVEEMEDPIPLANTLEYKIFQEYHTSKQVRDYTEAKLFVEEFDSSLGNVYAKLVSYSNSAEKILAASVRTTLGLSSSSLNDTEALLLCMSPERNVSLASTLNETSLNAISRAMFNVHYTFQKKISHTADSQDQRHRMVPASRPILFSQYTGSPDYIVPEIIKKYAELEDVYTERMHQLFRHIEEFIAEGGAIEDTSYLLPNAFPVRFYESGDLLNLHHKWKARLCYNAQEEIFYASLNEVKDIEKVHPQIAKNLGAPCKLRSMGSVKPVCPEGDRYCGVKVWKLNLSEYDRIL